MCREKRRYLCEFLILRWVVDKGDWNGVVRVKDDVREV